MTIRPFNPLSVTDKRTGEPDDDPDHCSAYNPERDGDAEELRRKLVVTRALCQDLTAWIERNHNLEDSEQSNV